MLCVQEQARSFPLQESMPEHKPHRARDAFQMTGALLYTICLLSSLGIKSALALV